MDSGKRYCKFDKRKKKRSKKYFHKKRDYSKNYQLERFIADVKKYAEKAKKKKEKKEKEAKIYEVNPKARNPEGNELYLKLQNRAVLFDNAVQGKCVSKMKGKSVAKEKKGENEDKTTPQKSEGASAKNSPKAAEINESGNGNFPPKDLLMKIINAGKNKKGSKDTKEAEEMSSASDVLCWQEQVQRLVSCCSSACQLMKTQDVALKKKISYERMDKLRKKLLENEMAGEVNEDTAFKREESPPFNVNEEFNAFLEKNGMKANIGYLEGENEDWLQRCRKILKDVETDMKPEGVYTLAKSKTPSVPSATPDIGHLNSLKLNPTDLQPSLNFLQADPFFLHEQKTPQLSFLNLSNGNNRNVPLTESPMRFMPLEKTTPNLSLFAEPIRVRNQSLNTSPVDSFNNSFLSSFTLNTLELVTPQPVSQQIFLKPSVVFDRYKSFNILTAANKYSIFSPLVQDIDTNIHIYNPSESNRVKKVFGQRPESVVTEDPLTPCLELLSPLTDTCSPSYRHNIGADILPADSSFDTSHQNNAMWSRKRHYTHFKAQPSPAVKRHALFSPHFY